MLKLIRNIALSALLGLGAAAPLATTASADSLVIRAGNGQAGFAIQVRDRGHAGRHGHWHGPRHRACTPGQAVSKAGRMGVRHARVQRVSHRNISVSGRARGHHVRVLFARAPGCPVLR